MEFIYECQIDISHKSARQTSKRVRTVWIGHGHKSEIKTTTTIGLKNINVYKTSYNGKTTLLP